MEKTVLIELDDDFEMTVDVVEIKNHLDRDCIPYDEIGLKEPEIDSFWVEL